jgi:hypothetical protein
VRSMDNGRSRKALVAARPGRASAGFLDRPAAERCYGRQKQVLQRTRGTY